jgi:hypothetical protein
MRKVYRSGPVGIGLVLGLALRGGVKHLSQAGTGRLAAKEWEDGLKIG